MGIKNPFSLLVQIIAYTYTFSDLQRISEAMIPVLEAVPWVYSTVQVKDVVSSDVVALIAKVAFVCKVSPLCFGVVCVKREPVKAPSVFDQITSPDKASP